jgi:hypothetical protein
MSLEAEETCGYARQLLATFGENVRRLMDAREN